MLSTGFNGFARQVFDDPGLLSDPDEKLRLICHAEQNAIHNAARFGVALQGATIHVTKFPCLACCNAIIQAGVVGIHTHDTKFWGDDPADKDHSRKKSILRQAGIKVDAPFHPHYAPKRVTGTPSLPGAAVNEVPVAKCRRKGPKSRDASLSLFAEPIKGSRSGT